MTRDTTPLTCEAKVAGYKFKLILDSGSSVSVISKHFLEAIACKIDEPSRRDLSNVHGQRKRALGIAKEVPVTVNGVTISADMEVMDTDAYAIIVGNGWLKEAKALIDYETCQLTIRSIQPPVLVQCQHWTEKKEANEETDEETDKDTDSEDEEEEAHVFFAIFSFDGQIEEESCISHEGIRVNNRLTPWLSYDRLLEQSW